MKITRARLSTICLLASLVMTFALACAHDTKSEEPIAPAQNVSSERMSDDAAFGDDENGLADSETARISKKGATKVVASAEDASAAVECTKKFDIVYISLSKVFFAPITRENLEKTADSTFTTSSCELEKMTSLVRRSAASGNADKADVRIRITDTTDNFVYFITMDALVASGSTYREVGKDHVKAVVTDIQAHLP